jgi:hypothetical protein
MKALLVHGMGRTPASQLLLALRLEQRGIRTHLFGYSTLASFRSTTERLAARAAFVSSGQPLILIGHSLGSVLIRAALPALSPVTPSACYFLAPPSKACLAARHFSRQRLFRFLAGEAGRLLADEAFMSALPVPSVPVRIYAGTAGPRGLLSPFGDEPNDGILAVSETALGSFPVIEVPSLHTFIMNSRLAADDIATYALSPDPHPGVA